MRCCLTLLIAVVLCCSLIGSVEASINYSVPGSTVSENFDTLATSGTGNTWTDNATIAGWYSSRTAYNAGTGSSNTGALYSFGSAGSNERALGSVGSNGTGTITYGIKLINTTGFVLDKFTVEYVGEQWRDGGNTAQQSLTLDYQLDGGLFSAVSALDFQGPVASATAAALDGNDSANSTTISHTLTGITWNPGDELFLRWTDINDSGNDHGLAIDDFTFKADYTRTGVVPEPASMLVWGGIGLLGLGLAAYKKKSA